jgi:hypothetical protein
VWFLFYYKGMICTKGTKEEEKSLCPDNNRLIKQTCSHHRWLPTVCHNNAKIQDSLSPKDKQQLQYNFPQNPCHSNDSIHDAKNSNAIAWLNSTHVIAMKKIQDETIQAKSYSWLPPILGTNGIAWLNSTLVIAMSKFKIGTWKQQVTAGRSRPLPTSWYAKGHWSRRA